MKGYFSQLARHTGVRFAGADRQAGARVSVRRPTALDRTTADAPLHVDEVVLVSPASATSFAPTATPSATVVDTRKDPRNEPRNEQATRTSKTQSAVHAAAPTEPVQSSIEVAPDSPARQTETTDSPTPRFTTQVIEQQSAVSEQQTQSEKESALPEREEPIESIAVSFTSVAVANTEAPTHSDESESTAPPEIEEVHFTDPVDQENLVRQYLREVRAWVAAAPTENESDGDEESLRVAERLERVTHARANDSNAPRFEQTEKVDVHDLSLSIGSISVVVEEPRPAPVQMIAPPPSPPATRPQATNEPTSLSRYYLRSW